MEAMCILPFRVGQHDQVSMFRIAESERSVRSSVIHGTANAFSAGNQVRQDPVTPWGRVTGWREDITTAALCFEGGEKKRKDGHHEQDRKKENKNPQNSGQKFQPSQSTFIRWGLIIKGHA